MGSSQSDDSIDVEMPDHIHHVKFYPSVPVTAEENFRNKMSDLDVSDSDIKMGLALLDGCL